MELHKINPHVRFAKYFENSSIPSVLKYCYDCRLFYIKEGSGTLEANNVIYHFSNNSVLFIPPGTAYRFVFTEQKTPPVFMVFNFDLIDDFSYIKESLGTANESNFNPEKVIIYDLPDEFSDVIVQTIPLLYERLRKCTNEFLHKYKYYRETISAILKSCLLELLRQSAVTSEFKIVSQLTKYVHEHFNEAELKNEDIAKEFGYHPFYLSQLMKQVTGETLRTYLLHYRIRIAKDYLITTDWEISTIAWKCGFNSTSYFIKQFKLRTGLTPHQFRKSNKNMIF